jgi:glyoxylase-like metal-dependent hydrolase (beta-lactamase superfamily II)
MTFQSGLSISRRDIFIGAAAAGIAVAAGGAPPARAAAPPVGKQVPSWYRFKIGDYEATVVSDGPLPLGKPEDGFKGVPKAELDKLLSDNFLPTDLVTLEQNALVVNTGRNLVLFDTGMGTAKAFGPTTGKLLDNIKASGIDPAQIDTVCVTHAHIDHCWALMSDDGKPNFPNANVSISKADYDWWTDEAKLNQGGWLKDFVAGARKHLVPLRDRTAFAEDGKEVVPGVTALFSPGHTVGHMAYVVSSGTNSVMFTGDLCHHQILLLQRPKIEFAFDTDAKKAVESRIRVFDMLAAQRMPLLSYHFPFPGLGHVTKAGEGYNWHPAPMKMVL